MILNNYNMIYQLQFRYFVKSYESLEDYQNNKPQHFKNRPPAPIELVGEWEVALSEIMYPNNWYNIQTTTNFSLTFAVTPDDFVLVGTKFEKFTQ